MDPPPAAVRDQVLAPVRVLAPGLETCCPTCTSVPPPHKLLQLPDTTTDALCKPATGKATSLGGQHVWVCVAHVALLYVRQTCCPIGTRTSPVQAARQSADTKQSPGHDAVGVTDGPVPRRAGCPWWHRHPRRIPLRMIPCSRCCTLLRKPPAMLTLSIDVHTGGHALHRQPGLLVAVWMYVDRPFAVCASCSCNTCLMARLCVCLCMSPFRQPRDTPRLSVALGR